MKRVITCLLVVALVFSIGLPEAFAAGFERKGNGDGICNQTGSICVRQNRDGCFSRTCHVDTDGDGICDFAGNKGAGNRGANFTDTDDDGICDNRTGTQKGKRCTAMQGGGRRRGCR